MSAPEPRPIPVDPRTETSDHVESMTRREYRRELRREAEAKRRGTP
jgi:hypothetical protein